MDSSVLDGRLDLIECLDTTDMVVHGLHEEVCIIVVPVEAHLGTMPAATMLELNETDYHIAMHLGDYEWYPTIVIYSESFGYGGSFADVPLLNVARLHAKLKGKSLVDRWEEMEALLRYVAYNRNCEDGAIRVGVLFYTDVRFTNHEGSWDRDEAVRVIESYGVQVESSTTVGPRHLVVARVPEEQRQEFRAKLTQDRRVCEYRW